MKRGVTYRRERPQLRMEALVEPERRGVIAWLTRKAEQGGDVVISHELVAWLARELAAK